jgi:plasmid stabilization system protein ParE
VLERNYDIIFAPTAAEDLAEILEWLQGEAPQEIREWYTAIKAHIRTLDQLPTRCPLAPEDGLWGKETIRQLLFQGYPSKYRILFTTRGQQVQILNIRHGARQWMHETD